MSDDEFRAARGIFWWAVVSAAAWGIVLWVVMR